MRWISQAQALWENPKVWILFWLSLAKKRNKLIETELNSNILLILSQLEHCIL